LTTRLAVLGSPIAHSKSPALHAAAYRALDLDWGYEAIEVTGEQLPGFMSGLDSSWRGLSLTMPLKRDVIPLLDTRDELVSLTGVANTVVFGEGTHGFNTDVHGITEAFRTAGIDTLGLVHVLGGGATAASALVASARLGAERIVFFVREPQKAAHLAELGAALDLDIAVRPLGIQDRSLIVPSAVISTLPGHSDHGVQFAEAVRAQSVLLDVAYDPWPSALATAWLEAQGTVISGLEMLLHQAVAQVRLFTAGDSTTRLHHEPAVLAAMRASVGA
jgi:shikimate dehydrogenase